MHVLGSNVANSRQSPGNPRSPKRLAMIAFHDQRRVAASEEFAASVRRIVSDVHTNGVEPVFLSFPRAMQLSKEYAQEDAASAMHDVVSKQ